MTPSPSNEEKVTFILLFSRNQPSCDVPYLMAQRDQRIYPTLLTTTFYFMRDLIEYRAISLQNAVYIIGGRYASTGRLSNAVFKYDAEIDFWRDCEPMKAARANFAVTIFESKIYVLGGEGLKGVIVQSVEAYDPVTNSWKEAGTFMKPKRNHAACTIHGKLWSCGGTNTLIEAKSTNEMVTVDPRPNEWKRSLTNYTLPSPYQQHSLAFINNNVLIFGGCQKNGDEAENIQTIVRAIHRSPESTPEWEELDSQLQHPRTDCGYFQLVDTPHISRRVSDVTRVFCWFMIETEIMKRSSLYIIGGHNCHTGDPTKMIERIDLTDDSNITIDEQFEIDKNLGAVDCCVVQTNQFNEHLLPLASYLDHWIMW